MLLKDVVEVPRAVAATSSRNDKVELLAGLLAGLEPEEAEIGISYLSGRPRQPRLGVGPATVRSVLARPRSKPTLSLAEVDEALENIASASGPGSVRARRQALSGLLEQATPQEQDYLRNLVLRNLRQGALEGLMAEAVARAVGVPAERVRRAAMLEGDLIRVGSRALAGGPEALVAEGMGLFTPVQPMLAKTATSAGAAVAGFGRALVERKLDGARIQVHRDGGQVVVYTRNLRDVTSGVPEVARQAAALGAHRFILDGETLIMGPGERPGDFQDSMSRFGSEGGTARGELSAFFFDCLLAGRRELIDLPLGERRRALDDLVPEYMRLDGIVTSDPGDADRFFEDSVALGYEGVMVKDLDSPYQAGRRGSAWLKVKPTHSLDLVILAAEWGSGRRRGLLSNLHLGARLEAGGYVMLGKTFKGLTDEMLRWQTGRFLELETSREGHIVHLEPRVVYEIAFDGVQRSTRYPGGVALRFARVRRHRDDKTPEQADTLETVRGFL